MPFYGKQNDILVSTQYSIVWQLRKFRMCTGAIMFRQLDISFLARRFACSEETNGPVYM